MTESQKRANDLLRDVEEQFPIGSYLTITFDTRRCVLKVSNYSYTTENSKNEAPQIIASYGINANDDIAYTFGLGEKIRKSTKEEIETLEAIYANADQENAKVSAIIKMLNDLDNSDLMFIARSALENIVL